MRTKVSHPYKNVRQNYSLEYFNLHLLTADGKTDDSEKNTVANIPQN